MACSAAWQMWSGVLKSGSPRLKSKTRLPSARSCRALAAAASVAEGVTAAASLETAIIKFPRGQSGRAASRGGEVGGVSSFVLYGKPTGEGRRQPATRAVVPGGEKNS